MQEITAEQDCMAESKEPPDEAFKVYDRRKFTVTGEERTDVPPEEAAPRSEGTAGKPEQKPQPGKGATRKEVAPEIRERTAQSSPRAAAAENQESAEFAAFLMSLANTAMLYLEAKDPLAGDMQQNMAAAKQMIEWISILQRKTEGNRTPEESHLMENLLYELRMQFLMKNKPPKL
ncbi:MAG: DUF1844 domain-containing protein [Acidobacteria bacterium]|nr:DUF1844 domain-containing protein [Acidobacteriota bacterium]